AYQQARQRAPALGAWPGGSARDPRRCCSHAHLLRRPPAARPAQSEGGPGPAPPRPALRHAARSDRLHRVLPPRPYPTSRPRAGAHSGVAEGATAATNPAASRLPIPCGRSLGDCWSLLTDLLMGTPTLGDPTIVDDRRRHHAPPRVREWMAGGR